MRSTLPPRWAGVRAATLVIGAAAFTGCDLVTDTACTSIMVPALMVDVVDSTTNAPAGSGARIIATDGAYADTTTGGGALAGERPGLYTVTVEQEGYRTWSRSGIRVTRDECHVRTERIVARLQR